MNTTPAYTATPVPPPAIATPAIAAPEQSAVSWSAILAGAAAAASLSLILLILGTGLGLSSVSPWAYEGVSREAFGWSSIAWITLTSIAASGLGGYLAGRLRTRWVSIHGDETYFRDTAHGFLAWAVATLLTAAVLTSAIGAILGTGAKAVGAAAGAATTAAGGIAAAGAGAAGAAASGEAEDDLQYWVDALFRRPAARPTPADAAEATVGAAATPSQPRTPAAMPGDTAAGPADADLRPEIGRILANGLRGESLDADDARYIAQRIAERTGLSQAEAEARVADMETRLRARLAEAETSAREMADDARAASAYAALWLFITLLIGAFSASLLATFGGRQRDR